MAGPTVKLFKYIAPPTPRRLIDESVFILDFNTRKFITTGLDPADNFNTIIQIVTPSRYVKLTPEFLKKVFSLMGYVFSIILDPDFKRIIFLDTEYYKLSTMKYREDNMLVIESKIEKECRILLNRTDLLPLQNIEYSIFETIERKNKFVLPSILHQFDQISTYMKKIIKQPTTVEDISLKISNFQDRLIKASILDVEQSFISQLKLLASEQLAVDVVNKMEKDVVRKLKYIFFFLIFVIDINYYFSHV